MEEKGKKFDVGKPELSLLPKEALEEISKVLSFGASKYGRNNWKKGIEYTRLLDASLRHLYAYSEKQDNDPESGISHVAHAACNLLFILWQEAHKKEMDNR